MSSFYVCKNVDDDVRKSSASGGIFVALAKFIINRGGLVYGAAFDDNFKGVSHVLIRSLSDLDRIRGSKYVFSKIGQVYHGIKENLEVGKLVLFSGTPCQVAGLKNFLKKDYIGLICVDIVCHGVADKRIYDFYLDYLERKYNSIITYLTFRDKSESWRNADIVIKFKNGDEIREKGSVNAFMQGFISNLYIRKSCTMCKYKKFLSKSDLTLGDFWGSTELKDYSNDDYGTSIVAVHTQKGYNIFNGILGELKDVREVDENTGYVFNDSYKKVAVPHPKSNYFYEHYQEKDFNLLVASLLVETPKVDSLRRKVYISFKRVLVKSLERLHLKTLILSFYNSFLILEDYLYRITHKNPKVVGILKTLEYIKNNHCSVVRYGDGEFKFVLGMETWFQPTSFELRSALKKILLSDNSNVIVCLMPMFGNLGQYEQGEIQFWTSFNIMHRKDCYKYLNRNKTYYNSFISRCYMPYKDKSITKSCFNLWKEIWNEKDLLIVEGAKTRLGVGNDLFDNVKSIKRILAPNTNAFSLIDRLFSEVKKYSKNHLVLLALGPTATVLAYRLALEGFWAIDIGHIDIEYEWYIRNAKEKIAIPNKYVIEAKNGKNVSEFSDPIYNGQIVASFENTVL